MIIYFIIRDIYIYICLLDYIFNYLKIHDMLSKIIRSQQLIIIWYNIIRSNKSYFRLIYIYIYEMSLS